MALPQIGEGLAQIGAGGGDRADRATAGRSTHRGCAAIRFDGQVGQQGAHLVGLEARNGLTGRVTPGIFRSAEYGTMTLKCAMDRMVRQRRRTGLCKRGYLRVYTSLRLINA